MRAEWEPPEKVGRPRTPLPADTTTTSTPARIKTSSCRLDCMCRRSSVGRHADVWREGFGYGFRDALRLAAREISDPRTWLVLDKLADDYDLAGER